MGQITGKVVLKETGAGIPNLVVAAYDDQQALKAPVKSRRLGSVVTNSRGEFAITYSDSIAAGAAAGQKARAAVKEGPLNLRLVVTVPEDPTVDPSPPPLYSTPNPRQSAAAIESFVIQLPRALCQRARLQAAGAITDLPQTSALSDLVTHMQKLGAVAPKKPQQPFSKRYQARRDAAAKRLDGKKPTIPPIRGFNFAMPLGFTGEQAAQGVTITNNPATGELLIKNKDDGAPVPLTFGGFHEVKPDDGQKLPASNTFLLIDPGKKELQICLVPSPGLLRATKEKRSGLLDWYRRQQKGRQA
jgi:hypothetical protein